jgi:protein O-mannosyl-transferase
LVVSFLVTVSVLAWKQRWTRRYLLIGWLWYLATLVPVSGVLWMGNCSRADRYAYIPLIGIFVMVVWGAADWADAKKINLRLRAATAVTVLAVLSLLTWRQVGYWQSDLDLWSHALKIDQNNTGAGVRVASIVCWQAVTPTPGDALTNAVEALDAANISCTD